MKSYVIRNNVPYSKNDDSNVIVKMTYNLTKYANKNITVSFYCIIFLWNFLAPKNR